jgi:uncharacterized protein YvpB
MSKTLAKFPYFPQYDNEINPSGACNVTSVAMCLAYGGIRGDGSMPQLEDQLYRLCERYGYSRHDPYGLAALVNERFGPSGMRDDFTSTGTLEDIKEAIDAGQPCVIHGYFTRFGHIVVIKGYNDKGFVVNDPWGEYYSTGYDLTVDGEGLTYSYGLISRLCSPESPSNPRHIWLHKIYRK